MKRALLAGRFATGTFAATRPTWEMNGYQDFLRGTIEWPFAHPDGRLMPVPSSNPYFRSDQPEIWSVAQGTMDRSTWEPGGAARVTNWMPGEIRSVEADQPEVFAVAVDSKHRVCGTSRTARFIASKTEKATEYFAPGATLYLGVEISAGGALFVATGTRARSSADLSGPGRVITETGQEHVTWSRESGGSAVGRQ